MQVKFGKEFPKGLLKIPRLSQQQNNPTLASCCTIIPKQYANLLP
jgi:hypothetical protein